MFACDNQIHRYGPSSVRIALYNPVRNHANRLMNQFETAFALANGCDRKAPQSGWPVRCPLNIRTEPLVDPVWRATWDFDAEARVAAQLGAHA